MIELLQKLEELEQQYQVARVDFDVQNAKLTEVRSLRADPRFEVDWSFTLHDVLTPEETLEEITREREEALNLLDQQMEPIRAPFIALARDYVLEREVKKVTWADFEYLHSNHQLSDEAFVRLKEEQDELENRLSRDPA